MGSDSLETYVIECSDRFGRYGIVGFGVIDTQVPRLLDLMFSCRVQGKRVEHATLSFLLQRFVSGKKQDLHVNYRKTPKNAPSGRVFEEFGFEKIADKEGVFSLVFKKGREIPGQQVIEIKTFGFESELVSTR